MQVNVPDLSSIHKSVDGYKTYIVLGVGAAVIVANHFGFLPPGMTPTMCDANGACHTLDKANWIPDLFTLALGATFRSAITKATKPAGIPGYASDGSVTTVQPSPPQPKSPISSV